MPASKAVQDRKAAFHSVDIPAMNQKRTAAEWTEVFDLARELQRRAAVDAAARAASFAPEMLGLLVDCARGSNTFAGAGAAVRRLAALDVLNLATGGGVEGQEWRQTVDKNDSHKQLPTVAELTAFIEAGSAKLATMRAKASAIDAVVIDATPADSRPGCDSASEQAGQQAGR